MTDLNQFLKDLQQNIVKDKKETKVNIESYMSDKNVSMMGGWNEKLIYKENNNS